MVGRRVYEYIFSRLRRITHAGGRFFVPRRDPFFCGHVHQDLPFVRKQFRLHKYLLDDVFEYQEDGQIASFKRFLKGGKQLHVKIFKGKIGVDIHAHKEYSYRTHPLKHINKEEFEDCCEVIKTIIQMCQCDVQNKQ